MRLVAATLALVLIALFVVACEEGTGATAPAPAPAPTDPSGPEAAFRAYRKVVMHGDIDELLGCLAAEVAAQFDEMKEKSGMEASAMLAMIRDFIPSEFELVRVTEDGDAATIELTADDKGEKARGTVSLKREEGAWKIERESWAVGDASVSPTVHADPIEAPPVPANWKPEGEWRLDCHEAGIPERNALGQVAGMTFNVASAEIQNDILTLSDGDGFDWKTRMTIFLFVRDDKGVEGRTVVIGPEDTYNETVGCHVHINWRDEEGGFQSDSEVSGYSIRLEFGTIADGKLPGRIYVAYPDDAKSYVAGKFHATVLQ